MHTDDHARRHAHLDPIGGIAGDMFVAACLDAHPHWRAPVEEAMRACGLPPTWTVEVAPGTSSTIAGTRLDIRGPGDATDTEARDHAQGHDHAHPSGDAEAHRHDDSTGSHRQIRHRLIAADLDDPVRDRALDIFARLAAAEAEIHGVEPDDVHFHEIADWDSIADIVGAAWCIDALGADSWSSAPLPLGAGTVRTAHGVLPVPAPAAALLLRGRAVVDDGLVGERVTPTGAAIVAHLDPISGPRPSGAIVATGHGLGTRTLPDRANLLRLLVFDSVDATAAPWTTTTVTVIEFEIDDQTGEDLATGLAALRAVDGVLDVAQYPVYAKKGRLATAVRLLATTDARDRAIAACFDQTSTIGLRWHDRHRAELPRQTTARGSLSGKLVTRPSGASTAKPDADVVAAGGGTAAERASQRARFTIDEDAP